MRSLRPFVAPLFVALLVGAAPSTRAEKLVVSGTSDIKSFPTLRVTDTGELMTPDGMNPGKVMPAGAVQVGSNFKASALAGAKLTFNGEEVGKINAAGTHVITKAGVPALPGWLASLSKPKEKPVVPANNFNDVLKVNTVDKGLVGAAHGNLEVFDVRLFINNRVVSSGATVEVGEGPLSWRMCMRVKCPGAKHEVGYKYGMRGPGGNDVWTSKLSVGAEVNQCTNPIEYTPPKGKDLKEFRATAFVSMPGELTLKNNEVDVDITLKIRR